MDAYNDKNWELLEAMLTSEVQGKTPRLFSSRRTLFGIPSALDEELSQLVKADDFSTEKGSKDRRLATENIATPQHVVHPLAPVFDGNSSVLILGTMPSPKSRETGFYYNHPQNRFWKVLAALFNQSVPQTNKEKRDFALEHHLALWDVLAECTIEGAKDGSIAQCVPNDLSVILGQAPIRAIFCTGAKAAELYGRYCEEQAGISCVKLPSTSPANAAFSLEDLIASYRQILKYL